MSTAKTTTVSIGGLFPSLLTVLFVGLKLTNHIDWSWWWVVSPMWLPLAVFLGVGAAILAVIGLGLGFCWVWEKCFGRGH